MGAFLLFIIVPFVLIQKEPKNQGRHHRTQRTKRALPRHVGQPPRPARFSFGKPGDLRFARPRFAPLVLRLRGMEREEWREEKEESGGRGEGEEREERGFFSNRRWNCHNPLN